MSTVCKLCIATDEDMVLAALDRFFAAIDVRRESSEWPIATDPQALVINML